MTIVSIYEAKTHLSTLIASVERKGEKIIICKHGRAVAEIVPVPRGSRLRIHPKLKKVKINDDLTHTTEEEWENV